MTRLTWQDYHLLSAEDAAEEAARIAHYNEHPDIQTFRHEGSQVNLAPYASGLYVFNTYTPHSERGNGGMTRMMHALYAQCDRHRITLWTHPENPWLEARLTRSQFGWEKVTASALERDGMPLYKRLPNVGE